MNKELVNQMKELTDKGIAQGKVLSVSEAFVMYPVEKEVHKGNLDYWLSEEGKSEL